MFINGDWVDIRDRVTIYSPATEEAVATVAYGGVEHADAAVSAALAAHNTGTWRSMSPWQRADILDATADHLAARLDDLVHLEAQEAGVTVRQATAFHVGYAISHLHHFADLARRYPFETTCWLHAGQACESGTRLLLPDPLMIQSSPSTCRGSSPSPASARRRRTARWPRSR